ncbi:MAG TPA: hypothetical protein VMN36_00990 [Verrucomicrobiales bacterium]|nr:hypothetical protein [Verrucomicrobiales bacterium]
MKNVLRNAQGNGVHVDDPQAHVVVRLTQITKSAKAIQRAADHASAQIATALRGSTYVEGTLNGKPGEELLLDFYAYAPLAVNPEADLYLGSTSVKLDPGGFGSYHALFPSSAPHGWRITATATDTERGTSGLSSGSGIAPPTDSDGDGLPDFWEDLHPECLDAADPDDRDADCDNDGLTNLQEYMMGKNPTVSDSSSIFRIASVSPQSVEVEVEVVGGRRYTLEGSALSESAVASQTVAASEPTTAVGTIVLIDPSPPEDFAVYRIAIASE